MDIPGTVHNGVIVLEGGVSLPEGTAVTVTLRATPANRLAKKQNRVVEFPLIPSSAPGSIELTNERIQELLDEEDMEAMKRTRNVRS